MDRRLSANALVILSVFLSLCTMVSVLWSASSTRHELDRLGDRLTAAISAEVHSVMWDQIEANHKDEADERRLLEKQLSETIEVHGLLIENWRERIIRKHPDLGDQK